MSAEKMPGYAGKILKVNLTTREIGFIDTSLYSDKYLGGRGIAHRLYWELVPPEISAYDERNCLIFMTGVLTGTGATSSARMFLVSKSPATYPREICFCSNMAGAFGPALKREGYDGMIITGKSETPVYLLISNGVPELRDAEDMLWGLDTYATKDNLWRRHGRTAEILTIGQAGENLVRESIIQSSAQNSFSQGGFGAVMGSKKLKAIVAIGKGEVTVADPDEMLRLMRKTIRLISKKDSEEGKIHQFRNNYAGFPSFLTQEVKNGTAWLHAAGCDCCALACMTGYKYLDGTGAGVIKCSIGAGLYNKIDMDGPPPENIPPEEMVAPLLGRDSLISTRFWERYGVNAHFLEMLSQGLRGFIYKLIDAGLITEENSGLPMDKLGKPVFALEMLKKVVFRENEFGRDMAEGPARFAEKWGPKYMEVWKENYFDGEATLNVHQFTIKDDHGEGDMPDNLIRAVGVRMREVYAGYIFFGQLDSHDKLDPSYSDREFLSKVRRKVAKKFLNNEEACDDPDDYKKAPLLARFTLCQEEILDSLGCCGFVFPLLYSNYTEDLTGELVSSQFLHAATGMELSEQYLADEFGMRIIDLERAIMAREGRVREEDKNPDIMFTDHGGRYDRPSFDQSLIDFYKIMSWDETTGGLKKEELIRYDLADVAEYLEERHLLPA